MCKCLISQMFCSLLNVKFYKKEKNSLILLEVEEMGVLTHRGYWRGNPKQ
jgi:hypothetical protein